MARTLKTGDHVSWNSEAGRVSGRIIKKLTSETVFKGYVRHASRDAPQYLIKSDRTDHIAVHQGSALRLSSPGKARPDRSPRSKRHTPSTGHRRA